MIRKSIKSWLKRFLVFSAAGIGILIAGYMFILAVFPFPHQALSDIRFSKCVLDKNGQLLRAFTGTDDNWLMPVELSEVNPYFIKATLSIEDKRFMRHHGVDFFAVARAAKLNISNKKIISGASTISMQAIRLLEGRKRSFLNKAIEAAHAVRLETLYSKDKILKLYFEIAPYGGNIRGVKAASLRYFQKYPKDLTLAECALLAGLPQSPSRLRPDRHPERAKKRRDMVLFNMLKGGLITPKQYEEAKNELVLVKVHSFPFKAPHFAEFVNKRNEESGNVITTLDPGIQNYAEVSLKATLEELRYDGVTNGAVVVIENKTGKIRALVGSSDFFSKETSGQINGALSRRCPGSALKPFTYAIAFDEGLYTPNMILADVRSQYSGYTPVDYDKDFRGPVTVREALVNSLNVPAVEVLDKISFRKLYIFLKQAGVSLSKPPEHYGLSLTLGSAEVSLLELTNAYAMLGRLGEYKPYTFIEGVENNVSKRLLSEGAAYLIADILSDSERLESIGIYRDEKVRPKVAWKTGTSYGHKDAWTVCYNPDYTIGVWLGNFSGKPTRGLMGINAAAPLAIKVFDWLYSKRAAPWYEAPATVGERSVCALSGQPISEICPHATKDYFLKERSLTQKCSVHQKIPVDEDTGFALDPAAKEGRRYIEKVVEVWPESLQVWLKIYDPTYLAPPKYMLISRRDIDLNKNKPKIISPAPGCEYFVSGMQNTDSKLPLIANGHFDSDYLYWFVDGKFFDKIASGQKLFWDMQQGSHKITCSDNYGRSASVSIMVR